ncbi:HotDog domain-containing protein, partial [Lophiotrema nucula]
DWTPTRTATRIPKPKDDEDSFFAETLGTQRTIRQCLTLRPTKGADEHPEVREVRTLLDLGSGMNGHPNVCHGGFVATMLDEILGVLVQLILEKKLKSRLHEGGNVFTAYLTTNYKKPTPTPSIVLCTAKFDRQERNKIYVVGSIEDGMGTVYATGEGMFVHVK